LLNSKEETEFNKAMQQTASFLDANHFGGSYINESFDDMTSQLKKTHQRPLNFDDLNDDAFSNL